jgi:8-oxo-dGTP pyrophosphatase MutT (NUDIX family)
MKVGVFLFLVQGNEILLLRRFQTGIDDNRYVVPMGGHDGKEPLKQSLIREAKEEVNIDLKLSDIEVCHVMHRFHQMPQGLSFEQMDVYFKARSYEGVIKNAEPDTCDEVKFFPLHSLPENTAPFIRRAIENMEKGEFFSEFGW